VQKNEDNALDHDTNASFYFFPYHNSLWPRGWKQHVYPKRRCQCIFSHSMKPKD